MNKNKYLNHPEVQGFVEFLSSVIEGDIDLNHRFVVKDRMIPKGYDRNVEIHTLEDAFKRYFWDKGDFDENSKKLNVVQKSLEAALASENNQAMSNAIEECMAWGFGKGRRAYSANVNWAKERVDKIWETIKEATDTLNSPEPETSRFNDDLRMNSGYTKVYALICPDSIIYDGRVGGGIGYLARKYCEIKHYDRVPPELTFRWGEAAGNPNRNRNPSSGNLTFPRLYNNGSIHAEWNIKANWVIKSALEKSNANWCSTTDGLRRIEAALFMVGYHL